MAMDPRAIYRDIGERVTRALVSGAFELFEDAVSLPLKLVPRAGPVQQIDTRENLQRTFEAYHRQGRLHNVTDLYRDVFSAEHTRDDEITVRFRLHILAGATRIVEPFTSTHVLRQTGADWRIAEILTPLGHVNWLLGRGGIQNQAFTGGGSSDAET